MDVKIDMFASIASFFQTPSYDYTDTNPHFIKCSYENENAWKCICILSTTSAATPLSSYSPTYCYTGRRHSNSTSLSQQHDLQHMWHGLPQDVR